MFIKMGEKKMGVGIHESRVFLSHEPPIDSEYKVHVLIKIGEKKVGVGIYVYMSHVYANTRFRDL